MAEPGLGRENGCGEQNAREMPTKRVGPSFVGEATVFI
jgi:hypothetical protein